MKTTLPPNRIHRERNSFLRPATIATCLLASLWCLSAAAVTANDQASSIVPVLTPATDGQLRLERGTYLVLDLYRQWGKAYDIRVLFDPKIRDEEVEIELGAESGEKALALLLKAAGHFATPFDAKTVLIAADTPQNRREYEHLAIKTFPLQNVDVRDAMTLLRSLVNVKHIAAQEDLNSLTIRETAATVELAERLLRMIDQPLAEAVIDAELLLLPAADRARLGNADGLPQRPSAAQLAELRRVSRPIMSHQLSVVEGGKGRWSILDEVPARSTSGDSTSFLKVGFELALEPRIHDGSQELSLELSLRVFDAALGMTAIDPSERSQAVSSSARLASGEPFLLSGFLPLDETAGPSLLLSRLGQPVEGPAELVMLLTPTVVRGRGYSDRDLEALVIGTESHLSLASRAGE